MIATQSMDDTRLDPATRLGAVHLTVADLERALGFYQRVMGLQVQARVAGTAALSAGREALVVLHERPGARRVTGHSGLYHFAILTPSRVALAEALRNLIDTDTRLSGSDHLVSEALYLNDPDGNGIEIYRDRPREAWPVVDGHIQMAVDPLDYGDILAELDDSPGPWAGMRPETVLGHMHLHVADLSEAERFYRNSLGFDLMLRYGDAAAFLSSGGYHHHIGINTWAGVGAPPPPADATGLLHFTVFLANDNERDRLRRRLSAAGAAYEERPDGLFVRDPSGNGILFV
jgi:catechol 2,3-dioxygenase